MDTTKFELKLGFDPSDQITGFSYSFVKKLIAILENGINEQLLFEADPTPDDRENSPLGPTMPGYEPVFDYLVEQTKFGNSRISNYFRANELFHHAKTFISLLEEQKVEEEPISIENLESDIVSVIFKNNVHREAAVEIRKMLQEQYKLF